MIQAAEDAGEITPGKVRCLLQVVVPKASRDSLLCFPVHLGGGDQREHWYVLRPV